MTDSKERGAQRFYNISAMQLSTEYSKVGWREMTPARFLLLSISWGPGGHPKFTEIICHKILKENNVINYGMICLHLEHLG